jgi:hypothetical protein
MNTVTAFIGWTATATFVASYFFVRPRALRATQILGALLWVIYGVLIGALPVVVANTLVMAAACWSMVRMPARGKAAVDQVGV